MFKIVASVIFMLGSTPHGNRVYTSLDQFETKEACEAAAAKSLPSLLEQVAADLPSNIDVKGTATCVHIEPDPAADGISDALRTMIRGGGFGTMRP
jgi:hypothetical protein